MLQPYKSDLVGEGSWYREIRKFIRQAAATRAPLLLLGEPGVGKELVARSIHFASRRRSHPFVTVDASLYYDRELERELFGVEELDRRNRSRKGLLEFSSKGTCYVACAEELPAPVQERLCEYLETGAFRRVGGARPVSSRVRLILASCRDVPGFSAGGLFSRRLFGHLAERLLEIAPLRAHPDDVAPFVRQLARHHSLERAGASRPVEFLPDSLEVLKAYPWPGNYDELKAEVLRVLGSGVEVVSRDSLAPEIVQLWLGREGVPQIRRVIEEIEGYIQEFRILMRLDAEYGDILLDAESWDLRLKCFDRTP